MGHSSELTFDFPFTTSSKIWIHSVMIFPVISYYVLQKKYFTSWSGCFTQILSAVPSIYVFWWGGREHYTCTTMEVPHVQVIAFTGNIVPSPGAHFLFLKAFLTVFILTLSTLLVVSSFLTFLPETFLIFSQSVFTKSY